MKRCGVRAVAALLAAVGAVFGQSASPAGVRFTQKALPVTRHVSVYGNCYAIAPANWGIYGSRREGDALDIASSDGRLAASWGSQGVPGDLARLYPQMYGSPEVVIHHSMGASPVSYGRPVQDQFGYTWLPFEIALSKPLEPVKGVVIYRVFPVSGDPFGFILVSRRAQAVKSLWETQGAQAIAVAVSIRCTVQLRPPSGMGGRVPSEEDRMESTYNRQLGTEYAHNPETGQLYWMSHSTDWKENGPQGPGYYIQSGNELKKLAQGLP